MNYSDYAVAADVINIEMRKASYKNPNVERIWEALQDMWANQEDYIQQQVVDE